MDIFKTNVREFSSVAHSLIHVPGHISWPFDFVMLACARVNVNRHSLTDENERKKTNLDERPVSDARVRAAWRSVLCYGFWIGIISTYIRLLSV